MSRHGFDEGDEPTCVEDDLRMWGYANAIKRATKGKRGQKFLRDLRDALDAMPEKRLADGSFVAGDGEVCALGCLMRARGVDAPVYDGEFDEVRAPGEEGWESGDETGRIAAEILDIAESLAREVMYVNDDIAGNLNPELRWQLVRRWVEKRIKA